jgi:hypothetical protein
MKTRPANNAVVLNHPQDILNRHLRQALKPHAAALRQAAALDLELAGEMTALHPDVAKKEANILLEAAANGDKRAEATLREAGGTDAYVRNKCGLFDLARAKFEGAAKASAPLWTKVSAAVITAIESANREIQEQWNQACDHLGEPPGLSTWDTFCRNLKTGITRAPFAAENLRHGAAWQIEALGLSEAIAE